MSKLIVLFNAIENRLGSTTLSIEIATLLSTLGKKTLLTSLEYVSGMEKYLAHEDINILYSLDNLKVFRPLTSEQLKFHVSKFNQNLDIIGGPQIIPEHEESFINELVEAANNQYEYVVVDASNQRSEVLFEKANSLLALLPFDIAAIHQYKDSIEKKYHEKLVPIFNKLTPGIQNELKPIMNSLVVPKYFYQLADRDIHFYSSISCELYSIVKTNCDTYHENLQGILYEIGCLEQKEAGGFWRNIFGKRVG